jgi:hypothetical protein
MSPSELGKQKLTVLASVSSKQELHDSQNREIVQSGHKSCGARNQK